MAIFPSDDLALDATTRRRILPLLAGYTTPPLENVKRNPPTNGTVQARDVWGRKKFSATMPFRLRIPDIELLMSFWEVYGSAGFTMFDFRSKQIGAPGYRAATSLGNATGALQTFTLPAKAVSGLILYKNVGGVPTVIPSGSITIHNGVAPLYDGAGAQGEATVDLAAGVAAAGQAITAAFLGRYRYTVIAAEAPQKSAAEYNLEDIVLKVVEQ